jgi:hypothetical protein
MGTVVVACFAATVEGGAADGNDHRNVPADQLSRQRWQTVVVTLRPAIFEPDILTFDIAGIFQALMNRRHIPRVGNRGRRAALGVHSLHNRGDVRDGQIVTLLLPAVMAAVQSGNLSIGGIISQAIAGGAGGAILTAIIGAIKNKAA